MISPTKDMQFSREPIGQKQYHFAGHKIIKSRFGFYLAGILNPKFHTKLMEARDRVSYLNRRAKWRAEGRIQ